MIIDKIMEEKINGTCLNCFKPMAIDETSEYLTDGDETELVKAKCKYCGTIHNYYLGENAKTAPKVESDYDMKCAFCGGTLIWSNDFMKDDDTLLRTYICLNCNSLVEVEEKLDDGEE